MAKVQALFLAGQKAATEIGEIEFDENGFTTIDNEVFVAELIKLPGYVLVEEVVAPAPKTTPKKTQSKTAPVTDAVVPTDTAPTEESN